MKRTKVDGPYGFFGISQFLHIVYFGMIDRRRLLMGDKFKQRILYVF